MQHLCVDIPERGRNPMRSNAMGLKVARPRYLGVL